MENGSKKNEERKGRKIEEPKKKKK